MDIPKQSMFSTTQVSGCRRPSLPKALEKSRLAARFGRELSQVTHKYIITCHTSCSPFGSNSSVCSPPLPLSLHFLLVLIHLFPVQSHAPLRDPRFLLIPRMLLPPRWMETEEGGWCFFWGGFFFEGGDCLNAGGWMGAVIYWKG